MERLVATFKKCCKKLLVTLKKMLRKGYYQHSKNIAKRLLVTFKKRHRKVISNIQKKYWCIILLYDNIKICNIYLNFAKGLRQHFLNVTKCYIYCSMFSKNWSKNMSLNQGSIIGCFYPDDDNWLMAEC